MEKFRIALPPWSERYPDLEDVMKAPHSRKTNIFRRNYRTSSSDPLFRDGRRRDFEIEDWGAVRQKVREFEAIAIGEIGLKSDEYRREAE